MDYESIYLFLLTSNNDTDYENADGYYMKDFLQQTGNTVKKTSLDKRQTHLISLDTMKSGLNEIYYNINHLFKNFCIDIPSEKIELKDSFFFSDKIHYKKNLTGNPIRKEKSY